MSDTWVDEPRKMPHRCRRSGRSSAADGPYFEDSLPYCEAPGDDRELTHYISPGWLRTIAEAPGSPIVVLTTDEHAELTTRLARAAEQITFLTEQLAAAQEPPPSPIDEHALADALVVRLDGRYARKTGPRPKAAA